MCTDTNTKSHTLALKQPEIVVNPLRHIFLVDCAFVPPPLAPPPLAPPPVSPPDFENHRTATEYEDSLVAKLFCFTFCNSYGGFIYLAFIGQPLIGVACEYTCMNLLATNLTIVFVVQLLVWLRNGVFESVY